MREYELVVILSPEATEEEMTATLDMVNRSIAERGGSVTDQQKWGLRRLAYPIKRHNEGNYVLTRFAMDHQVVRELENNLKVSEDVLRHLLIRVG